MGVKQGDVMEFSDFPLPDMPFILSVRLLIQSALHLVNISKRKADANNPF
jgi:hypothetical protein